MQLREYLDKNQITITDFAKQAGFCREFISLLLAKKRRIRPRNAKIISMSTNGEVSEEEILSHNKDSLESRIRTKKRVVENTHK